MEISIQDCRSDADDKKLWPVFFVGFFFAKRGTINSFITLIHIHRPRINFCNLFRVQKVEQKVG